MRSTAITSHFACPEFAPWDAALLSPVFEVVAQPLICAMLVAVTVAPLWEVAVLATLGALEQVSAALVVSAELGPDGRASVKLVIGTSGIDPNVVVRPLGADRDRAGQIDVHAVGAERQLQRRHPAGLRHQVDRPGERVGQDRRARRGAAHL